MLIMWPHREGSLCPQIIREVSSSGPSSTSSDASSAPSNVYKTELDKVLFSMVLGRLATLIALYLSHVMCSLIDNLLAQQMSE